MRGVGEEDQNLEGIPPPKKGWAHTSPRVGGFPTLPLGPSSRIVYVSKTPKTQWEKYGEIAQFTQHQVEYSIIWIEIYWRGCEESPPESSISLSLIILIPRTHLSKVDAVNDLVNKSARFSHDLVCKILTSFVFCNSCA